jgi:hypothetical protein
MALAYFLQQYVFTPVLQHAKPGLGPHGPPDLPMYPSGHLSLQLGALPTQKHLGPCAVIAST